MKPSPLIALVYLLLMSSPVSAGTSEAQPWLEMLDVCETLITDQTEEILDRFPAAKSMINVEPSLERAVRHPSAPLIASAMFNGYEWFLCFVAADPPAKASENGKLIGTITGTLYRQVEQSDDHAVIIDRGNTFAPVRVVCHDENRLISVFAYLSDEGEFRVAATNRLEPGAANPCREVVG